MGFPSVMDVFFGNIMGNITEILSKVQELATFGVVDVAFCIFMIVSCYSGTMKKEP